MGLLVLIRHGESEYNRDGKFTGLDDPPLTRAGKDQAVFLASSSNLKNIKPKKAFVSNLKRAQQTLDLIIEELDVDIDVVTEELLNERSYGDFTGEIKENVIKAIGSEQYLRYKHEPEYRIPNGESVQDVEYRVKKFLDIYGDEFSTDSAYLIVSHANVLRCMVKILRNLNRDDFKNLEILNGDPIFIDFQRR